MIPNNLLLTGDRVLIQLDVQPDHTLTNAGIVVPKFIPGETDGGKPKSDLDSRKHLFIGTVLLLSPLAQKRLQEQETPISKGDRVYVSSFANESSYQFNSDRSRLVTDFDGLIAIPHNLIEAVLLNFSSNG